MCGDEGKGLRVMVRLQQPGKMSLKMMKSRNSVAQGLERCSLISKSPKMISQDSGHT